MVVQEIGQEAIQRPRCFALGVVQMTKRFACK